MYKYIFLSTFVVGVITANAAYAVIGQTACIVREVYTSCNAGYYMSGTTCKPGSVGTYKSVSGSQTSCSACPSSGGTAGTTKSQGSTAITQCYIPAGASFSDSTGTYDYADDCYYSN